jgi:hypothetical protein
LAVREVNRIAYVILGADQGLAGAYTSNLLREIVSQVSGKDNVHLLTAGRKVRDYFRRRGYTIDQQYTGFSEKPSYDHAVRIARDIATAYAQGEYDEVYLVYTQFYSRSTTGRPPSSCCRSTLRWLRVKTSRGITSSSRRLKKCSDCCCPNTWRRSSTALSSSPRPANWALG